MIFIICLLFLLFLLISFIFLWKSKLWSRIVFIINYWLFLLFVVIMWIKWILFWHHLRSLWWLLFRIKWWWILHFLSFALLRINIRIFIVINLIIILWLIIHLSICSLDLSRSIWLAYIIFSNWRFFFIKIFFFLYNTYNFIFILLNFIIWNNWFDLIIIKIINWFFFIIFN